MQLSGRAAVIGIFVLSIVMAGGAWWRRLQESRYAAAYWGRQGAPLIVGDSSVEFFTLGEPAEPSADGKSIAGLPVAEVFDLTDQRGVVHLRYALTQDANFLWNELRDVPIDKTRWAYALRFAAAGKQLDVLLPPDLAAIGQVAPDGRTVRAVPCPRLAPKLHRYLADVKAPLAQSNPDQ